MDNDELVKKVGNALQAWVRQWIDKPEVTPKWSEAAQAAVAASGIAQLQAELAASRQEAKELGEMVDNYGDTILALNDAEVKLQAELDALREEMCWRVEEAYREGYANGREKPCVISEAELKQFWMDSEACAALALQPSVMGDIVEENVRASQSEAIG
jgi:hypothetical protein